MTNIGSNGSLLSGRPGFFGIGGLKRKNVRTFVCLYPFLLSHVLLSEARCTYPRIKVHFAFCVMFLVQAFAGILINPWCSGFYMPADKLGVGILDEEPPSMISAACKNGEIALLVIPARPIAGRKLISSINLLVVAGNFASVASGE